MKQVSNQPTATENMNETLSTKEAEKKIFLTHKEEIIGANKMALEIPEAIRTPASEKIVAFSSRFMNNHCGLSEAEFLTLLKQGIAQNNNFIDLAKKTNEKMAAYRKKRHAEDPSSPSEHLSVQDATVIQVLEQQSEKIPVTLIAVPTLEEMDDWMKMMNSSEDSIASIISDLEEEEKTE